MREHDLQNLARIELSKLGYVVFRINVGNFYTKDGRYIKSTVPKGFSDLIAIKDGEISFFEIKVRPNKPTLEQLNFIEQMQKIGCIAGVVYSMEDIYKLIEGVSDDVCDIRSTDSEGIDGTVEG
jgi:hypothetical protein